MSKLYHSNLLCYRTKTTNAPPKCCGSLVHWLGMEALKAFQSGFCLVCLGSNITMPLRHRAARRTTHKHPAGAPCRQCPYNRCQHLSRLENMACCWLKQMRGRYNPTLHVLCAVRVATSHQCQILPFCFLLMSYHTRYSYTKY